MSASLQHLAGSMVLLGLQTEGVPVFICIEAFQNGTLVYEFKL